ncbi:hypothetical protein [Asticcacaulis sp. EMRT-3]|uniref:hypothetical protein n=1 Tax=Asticcacaulis sp. EMRT-3 TaxID=3040349 RepID=UPI0024AEC10E|nr:hypothetical protein [Asticcacaulis sp. EMRT-3]MDI7774784.1 hypothetical protein [Asticcacaulis sp. EMRT-3]
MRDRSNLKAAAGDEISSSEFVPMGMHITADVVKLRRTGDYIATWRLDGIPFETVDPEDIHVRKEGLNNFLRSLGGGSFAIWSHKIRRTVRERLNGQYGNAFCDDLNARYYASFDTHRQMRTELYITLIYRPVPTRMGRFFKSVGSRTVSDIRAAENEALAALDDAAKWTCPEKVESEPGFRQPA